MPAATRYVSSAVALLAAALIAASPAAAATDSGAGTVLAGFLTEARGAVFATEDVQRGVTAIEARDAGGDLFDRVDLPDGAGSTWSEAKDSAEARAFLARHPVSPGRPAPARGGARVETGHAGLHDQAGTDPLSGAPVTYLAGETTFTVTAAGRTALLGTVPFVTLPASPGQVDAGLDRTRAAWSADGTLVAVSGHLDAAWPNRSRHKRIPVALVGAVPKEGGAGATPNGAAGGGGSSAWGCSVGGSEPAALAAALAAVLVSRRRRRGRAG